MRVIFHIDLDDFYAAVEEIENPSLRSKPLIVGGEPDKRGVVASVNQIARQFQVRPTMTTAQALRRCPQGVVVPLRIDLYEAYSEKLIDFLLQVSPLVEPVSLDEIFVDFSDQISVEAAPAEAKKLQSQIQQVLGLSVTIGVASNKLLAKIASSMDKPHGMTVVEAGGEAQFLTLLPVQKLDGIGPKTAHKLEELGVKTIGDLARITEANLIREFGANGAVMWRQAQGIDEQPVKTGRTIKSFSQAHTFQEDTNDSDLISATIRQMSDTLAERLSTRRLTARTVSLTIRYGNYSTLIRNITHDPATNQADDIYHQAHRLWQIHWQQGRAIRLIGVSVSNFVEGVEQLSLF